MITKAKTTYGVLEGVKKQSYCVFRGIPFAAPPVGELRWRKPQPPQSWEGVRPAKTFAPRAIAPGQGEGSIWQKEFYEDDDFMLPASEDCLYLNIWTPAASAEERLPVAFWIHGGGFVNGFPSELEFDGAAYAERGVILVTIAYRLGALGFLTHPWLRDETGISGNYGLYDMIAALDFVGENIGAFGGDKNNITIFGQSAGAMATQSLVSSKLTRGKIHQAIIQSGGGYRLGFNRNASTETMEKSGEEFIQHLGAASLGDLKKIPAERILEAQQELSQRTDGLRFGPYADGVILEGDANTLIEKGALHDIPYILGSTAGDMGTTPGADAKEGMLYKGCVAFSTFNETLGRKPAWVYYFTQRPQGDNLGAYHSSELWYMFGTLSRSWRPKTPGDWELSSRMLSYWCNFMKHGDPNGAALPPWKPCKTDDPFVMELEHGPGV